MTTTPTALTAPALPLVLGGNTFGWTSDEDQTFAVLDAFTAAGGTLVDTADSYSAFAPGNSGGESETLIGRWLADRGRPQGLVVATKVSNHPQFRGLAPENIERASQASLDRLGVERLDLYYAHFDEEERDIREIAGAFNTLVDRGAVTSIGVSNFSPERIRAWFRVCAQEGWATPVALQPRYNLVARGGFEQDYAPLAEEFGLAVFPYYALAAGFLTGKYRSAEDLKGAAREKMAADYATHDGFGVVDALDRVARAHGITPAGVALAWLVARGVSAPIASARTTEQLPALVEGVQTTLSEAEIAELDAASRSFA